MGLPEAIRELERLLDFIVARAEREGRKQLTSQEKHLYEAIQVVLKEAGDATN